MDGQLEHALTPPAPHCTFSTGRQYQNQIQLTAHTIDTIDIKHALDYDVRTSYC